MLGIWYGWLHRGRGRLLLPDCLDDYVGEDNLVRVIDVFVDELDLTTLGFEGPAATGRPGYSPATMLKPKRRTGSTLSAPKAHDGAA
jgi:hypothetical protein